MVSCDRRTQPPSGEYWPGWKLTNTERDLPSKQGPVEIGGRVVAIEIHVADSPSIEGTTGPRAPRPCARHHPLADACQSIQILSSAFCVRVMDRLVLRYRDARGSGWSFPWGGGVMVRGGAGGERKGCNSRAFPFLQFRPNQAFEYRHGLQCSNVGYCSVVPVLTSRGYSCSRRHDPNLGHQVRCP